MSISVMEIPLHIAHVHTLSWLQYELIIVWVIPVDWAKPSSWAGRRLARQSVGTTTTTAILHLVAWLLGNSANH